MAVVHGGGAALTRTLQRLGKESEFVNGLRVTDAETRDVALMVLAGIVNKRLVAAIGAAGSRPLDCVVATASPFAPARNSRPGYDLGFVGEIVSVEARWLEAIWRHGGIPVISSPGSGLRRRILQRQRRPDGRRLCRRLPCRYPHLSDRRCRRERRRRRGHSLAEH